MIFCKKKILSIHLPSLVAVCVLTGALNLLCIQTRINKAIPPEGPLHNLSSIAKMIQDRSPWPEQLQPLKNVEVEPLLYNGKFPEIALVALLTRLDLTLVKCNPLSSAYHLRPPP